MLDLDTNEEEVDFTNNNNLEYIIYSDEDKNLYKEIDFKENLEQLKLIKNKKNFIVKKTTLHNLVRETRKYLFSEDLEEIENSQNEKLQRKLYIEDFYKKSLFVFVNDS